MTNNSFIFDRCAIAIPVYNQIEFLDRVFASVAPLKEKGVRVIVVDDHSKPEVWNQLCAKLPQGLELVRNNKNFGLFGNWQHCLNLSNRPYTLILCSDDECCEEFVERAIRILDQDQTVNFVTSKGVVLNQDLEISGEIADFFPEGVYSGQENLGIFLDFHGKTGINPFNYPSGVLIRTAAALSVGGFDTTMKHIGDIDLYFRMLTNGSFAVLESVGAFVTFHVNQQGVLQGKEPIGVRELFVMDQKLRVLASSSINFDKVEQQHAALACFHALKFFIKFDFQSCSNYLHFIRSMSPRVLPLFYGVFEIIKCKLQVKFSRKRHPWAIKCNIRALPRINT